ncbi:hypothetical protein H6F67_25670 [Microcoleus sp. FACHB-1515]|uniref:DUF5674 family protein n=1 Tax=Cyanophyceae TaxID=3028117 RepID=UPI0016850BEC|nr:DUF5674 family protein [Microcoleus sp. FACHB-1515]MBD2093237.1 hypothetical protein [Microcoleus sp. FACHB-1515]
MICIIAKPATPAEMYRMSRMFGNYIKLAVDVERSILAGGGESHAECEAVLLSVDSMQQNIWGAGLNLKTHQIEYDSIINIRPSQGNRSMVIQDASIRSRINEIINQLIGEYHADS